MNPALTPDSSALQEFSAMLRTADAENPVGSDLMIVVAHPDDETIGIGGHLAALREADIIHVTDGAPRDLVDARSHGFSTWQDYAEARRMELLAAMDEAGVETDHLHALGIADQEAARDLAPLSLQLAGFFRDQRPRFVCTHPFEGGHPDHDATAFAVWAACRLIERTGFAPPGVIEMAFYHGGPDGPVYQDFIPGQSAACLELQLTEAELERKQRMIGHFLTQRRILASFVATAERFRVAPRYDFLSLPNDGRLLYEDWRLGLTGAEWLKLAAEALEELELAET
jgi:LmbE family N-acetylglucosaminyl deacetylase